MFMLVYVYINDNNTLFWCLLVALVNKVWIFIVILVDLYTMFVLFILSLCSQVEGCY